jgi:ABC-2 type transport system permease protein
MNLWRLELLRMIRTHRWIILLGVYLTFGILGPVTGRYLSEIVGSFAGEITIEVPDARPVDGILQFISNATQVGLLAVVIVAASALAIDARVEVAAFLRTRVRHAGQLLVPRFTIVAVTSVLALVVGTGTAWALTGILLGPLPAGPMVIGTLYGGLYLCFAVAVVAAAGALARGMLPAVFIGLGVLLTLPLIGIIPTVQPWLPSYLVTAIVPMIDGAPASDYLRAAAVTLVAAPALLGAAAWQLDRREL